MGDQVNSDLLKNRKQLDDLVERVKGKIGNPVSPQAVVAILESTGLRDIDAQNIYDSDSLFDLGQTVYDKLKYQLLRERIENRENGYSRLRQRDLSNRLFDFVKYYSYGLLFTAPMFSQILAVIFFSYSLWAWLYFNNAQATIVALGTIVAFIVTGGFALVLGRELSHYIGLKNYVLASKMARYIFIAGTFSLFAFWVLVDIINLVIPFYPQKMVWIGGVYMVLIGIWLLSSSVIYALQKHGVILISVVLGTVIVILAMNESHIGIYNAHWLGLLITNGLLVGYAWLHFNRRIRTSENQFAKQKLPRFSFKYFNNYSYFVYGILYFLFLFIDRILAWSTGHGSSVYVIWFNTPYELGMDWGLISLVLIVASIEYSINSFTKILFPSQEKTKFSQIQDFITFFKKFYARQVILLLLAGIVSILLNYYAISSLKIYIHQFEEIQNFFQSSITSKIFWWASISYFILAFGMLHALFFFTLGHPRKILYAMSAAVFINFIVGFICSRMISYEYAVIGLLAGSVTFSLITGYYMWDYLENLDYHFYSSY